MAIEDIDRTHVIIVIIMAVIGVLFALFSEIAFKELKGSCKSAIIRNGWTVIQALSVCLIVTVLSFLICITDKGSHCYNVSKGVEGSSLTLIIIFCLLSGGIMSIAIGILVSYNSLSKEEQEPCDSNSDINKKMAITISVLSVIVFIASIVWIVYKLIYSVEAVAHVK